MKVCRIPAKQIIGLAFGSAFSLLLCLLGLIPALAVTDIPPESLKIPRMVAEESVSTFVPSETAPGQGLAVNLIYPPKPRYPEGAPVVVVVPGGTAADGLGFSMHAAQAGFVEVRFAFPGGGKSGLASSGIYDNRGQSCQAALRDILLFAQGKLPDSQGRTVRDLVPVKVYLGSIGIVGWSNGGNIALVTLSKFAEQLGAVGWAAFYECPAGALFFPPNLGGDQDLKINSHYRQGSCATGKCLVDYRKLTWQADAQKNTGLHKRLGEPEIPGVLFFDENRNRIWDEAREYAFSYATDIGLEKQIYPPQVTKAVQRFRVFGDKWPGTVATSAESVAYFQERDGSLYVPDVCQKLPGLLVEIFGSKTDHMQRQPDHPHVALLYNAFLANRAKFVRLNPDPVYVVQAANMSAFNFVDNKPNASLDADAIDLNLEPEGLTPDYVFMDAAIAELSDRKRAKNLDADLKVPIVNYANGAEPAAAK